VFLVLWVHGEAHGHPHATVAALLSSRCSTGTGDMGQGGEMGRGRDMEQSWEDTTPVPSQRSFLCNLTHIVYRVNARCSDAVPNTSPRQGPSWH